MANWRGLVDEIGSTGTGYDVVRRKYLQKLHETTGRNVIAYYSGWLQKAHLSRQLVGRYEINDADKNGFMAAIHELDRAKGLDLILHTPGGEVAATESLVDYLRAMFGTNIRAVVPQIAMSAGTMIACACREILMGKHSSLGPVDPQFAGIPAHGIIEEFNRARKEIAADQKTIPLWQPIIAKYNPTLIGECEKAIKWGNEMVREWLMTGMFAQDADKEAKADRVIAELGDHALTKSHARHISLQRARSIGLKVTALEDDDKLQDAVLTVHHAFIHTLAASNAASVIENQLGVSFFQNVRPV
jgi:membrane-bound ClpP family serine protease